MQLYGLFWNKDQQPTLKITDVMEITGKNRSSAYGHLALLRNSGWLLFNTAHDGTLLIDFTPGLSKILDSQLLINSESIESVIPEKSRKSARVKDSSVQKIGQSKKLDGRDTRLDHPAIKAYRTIARLHVPVTWRDDVIAIVGDRSEEWARLVKDWIGRGWNKGNVKGMLDAFSNGGISGNRRRTEPPAKPEPIQTPEEIAEELRRL
jgi:hypothetical protein